MSERLVIDAVVSALGSLPAWASVHEVGDVPTPLPDNYVEVGVSRRVTDDGTREDGAVSVLSYRVTTLVVARMKPNAQTLVEDVTEALDFTTLAVGADSTTVVSEGGDPVGLDDDRRYSAEHTWTCTLPTLSK